MNVHECYFTINDSVSSIYTLFTVHMQMWIQRKMCITVQLRDHHRYSSSLCVCSSFIKLFKTKKKEVWSKWHKQIKSWMRGDFMWKLLHYAKCKMQKKNETSYVHFHKRTHTDDYFDCTNTRAQYTKVRGDQPKEIIYEYFMLIIECVSFHHIALTATLMSMIFHVYHWLSCCSCFEICC